MNAPRARILLVDDHPIVRQGLTMLIDQEPDLVVCGEACDVPGALEAIEALRPDLAVVDISLKDMDGLYLTREIHRRWPDLPTLTLSMHDEMLYAERVLQAGGRGYVMKGEAADSLVAAIRRVIGGGIHLSPNTSSRLLRGLVTGDVPRTPVARLSDREFEIFRLIGTGRTTRQIAEALQLSVKTIESYRERLKAKLRLPNAAGLVVYAAHWMVHDTKAPRHDVRRSASPPPMAPNAEGTGQPD